MLLVRCYSCCVPIAAIRIISQKETFALAHTNMHTRTDKIEGLLMNRLVIENNNTIDYLIKANSVANALSALLATDFLSDRFKSLPHSRRISNLAANYFLGDEASAWQELSMLQYFEKHLREIEVARPDLLQLFRREFRRAKLESQYFGLRFEVYVAASLIRKGVSFSKTESPDFYLDGFACGIECTTAWVEDGKSKDLSYKVTSAIRKKAESASHRHDCILFIDITNLFHKSFLATANKFLEETRTTLVDTNFSAIVPLAHMFNDDLGKLQTVHYREDNDSLAGGPLLFLNTHFPVLEDRSYEFSFPRGG